MEYKILDTIREPKDLKKLSHAELAQLATEIRSRLVEVVSETGGHLASNLGVVELTIALHRSLDSPKDKIIWDVGHQCYVHKLLTGRNETFPTLRQYGGISGFPKKSESEHDIFDSGHASNSISVALGIAEARDKAGGKEHIVAVIGDGSLTGGMAYEALNQAGHLGTRLIVLLNDNEMSISPNVGAISGYLARVRLDPVHSKLRKEIEQRIKKLPAIGELVYDVGMHIKESVKALLVPGMLFEELGFTYIGPIDGHDIKEIERNVALAKQYDGPVLIHVVTKKGLGYIPAVERPEKWHGIAPFIKRTGEPKVLSNTPTYTEVFGDTLVDLAKRDKRIVAITAAMTSGTGLEKFAKVFPDRFYDVGIAEQHAVTFAAGLALEGYLPVVAIYSTFLQRAYDQIMQDVSLQELPVVFAVDRAGIVGEDGPTHHGAFDLTYLRSVPDMVVMAPKDEDELRHMLYTATVLGKPVAVRYPRDKGLGVELSRGYRILAEGKGEILASGSDVCLLAIGRMVQPSLDAARMLGERGISASVVNMRYVKPIDAEMVEWMAGKHQLLVTIEENTLSGGFGSAVLEVLADLGAVVPILRLGLPDRFASHGSMKRLLAEAGLDANGIAYSVNRKFDELVSGKKRPGVIGKMTMDRGSSTLE
ncbi:MAG: 1-deoxy-D-xylulose-5-phosphate synthase [Actinomycetota bacterium]|nr:1-deoxy-D-xylulose-5-phosphate synthase [Actinomycetota bacterium]